MSSSETVARYSALARAARDGERVTDCDADRFTTGCFGPAGYPDTEGLPDGAVRASLGCGNPLAIADLRPGDRVLDLGSGGGIDVLRSAQRVGPTGTVYGLDTSQDMLALARDNAAAAGATRVEFLYGRIEDIPLPDGAVDVVISNCVVNLSADKPRVLAEAFRVLQPGGRLGISDVISDGTVDGPDRTRAELEVGCSAGTWTRDEYLHHLASSGFVDAEVITSHELGAGLHSAIVKARTPAR